MLVLTSLAAFVVGMAVYLALEGRWLLMVSVLLIPTAGGAFVHGLARVTRPGRRMRDWILVVGGGALSVAVVLLAVLDSGPA